MTIDEFFNMSIDDLVATFSEEEKIKLADLIKECREREAENKATRKEHQRLLRNLKLDERGMEAEKILKQMGQ